MKKNCDECGTEFEASKSNHRFCTRKCGIANLGRRNWVKNREKLQAKHKIWASKNFEKRKDAALRRTFGITYEQYESLLEKQDRKCFICQRHETEFSTKLAVDHDHTTQEIRGLLCMNCNKLIIGKNTDPSIFLKAYEYLNQGHTGWFVPENAYVNRQKKRKRKKYS